MIVIDEIAGGAVLIIGILILPHKTALLRGEIGVLAIGLEFQAPLLDSRLRRKMLEQRRTREHQKNNETEKPESQKRPNLFFRHQVSHR